MMGLIVSWSQYITSSKRAGQDGFVIKLFLFLSCFFMPFLYSLSFVWYNSLHSYHDYHIKQCFKLELFKESGFMLSFCFFSSLFNVFSSFLSLLLTHCCLSFSLSPFPHFWLAVAFSLPAHLFLLFPHFCPMNAGREGLGEIWGCSETEDVRGRHP